VLRLTLLKLGQELLRTVLNHPSEIGLGCLLLIRLEWSLFVSFSHMAMSN
jgi:hypothetical protein